MEQVNKLVLLLSPDFYCLIVPESAGSNQVLGWVACHWYNSIRVAFQFLNYFSGLKFPHIHTVILGATDNVFPICYRKRWRNAVLWVGMSAVCFQDFACWRVPKTLQNRSTQRLEGWSTCNVTTSKEEWRDINFMFCVSLGTDWQWNKQISYKT